MLWQCIFPRQLLGGDTQRVDITKIKDFFNSVNSVDLEKLEQSLNQTYYHFETAYFAVRSNYIISLNLYTDVNNGCIKS